MSRDLDRMTYDTFRDPRRQSVYRIDRRRVLITAAGGIIAATALGWANAATDGSLTQRLFVWVFIPVLLVVTVGRLLFLKGLRDSLRVYRDSIELPERSFFQAIRGSPNPVVPLDRVERIHIPLDARFPFVGFVTREGRVHLVHKRAVGDIERLREVLTGLGLHIVDDMPPRKTDWEVPVALRMWRSRGSK